VAAYDDSKQVLYLRFRNTGHVYRYFQFTAADNQAFHSAESKPLSEHPRSVVETF
jgi:hypothetical protein